VIKLKQIKIEDKNIVIKLRKEGMTFKEIGDKLGVTISRIQQIIKKLMPELGGRLKKEEKSTVHKSVE
jgi:DNA-directed RNA polymerase specialized sigma subunit